MFRNFSVLIMALFVTASLQPAQAQRGGLKDRLEVVETARIGPANDKVVMRVGQRDGKFRAIAIRPLDRPLNIRKLEIVFGNGDRQVVRVRDWLAENELSDLIDLERESRFIRYVEATIRPLPERRSARLQLLGVPAGPRLSEIETQRIRRGDNDLRYVLGLKEGKFKALAFRALGGAVNIRRLEVVFGNGSKQNVRVRDRLEDGEISDLIDLDGDKRFIKRVDVVVRPVRNGDTPRLQLLGVEAGDAPPPRGGPPPSRDEWVLLGEQTAAIFRTDNDLFRVGEGKGRFKAIRVKSEREDIRMYGMRITYGNGATEDVRLTGTLPAGATSQPFDLKGRDRFISHIEFRYRTRLNFKGSGRIQLWGLRN